MKKLAIYTILLSSALITSITSCKRSDNSIYFYSESRDTLAPTITCIVPLNGDYFAYGDDVHIVGNVTDLETAKTSGKLKSLRIEITPYNATFDTIVGAIWTKLPNVDGKDGYTFNEKFGINVGAGKTSYELYILTYDYSGRKAELRKKFYYQ